jgi:hypothetical protein
MIAVLSSTDSKPNVVQLIDPRQVPYIKRVVRLQAIGAATENADCRYSYGERAGAYITIPDAIALKETSI